MCTKNLLGFDNAEDGRVIQIIIGQKLSDYLQNQKMGGKIKLRWQWNSVHIPYHKCS